jgi:hypothetical protein
MDNLMGSPLKSVYASNQVTFQKGQQSFSADGVHTKIQFQTLDNLAAVIGSITMQYTAEGTK